MMDHRHDSVNNIRLAFFLNLAFTFLEIAGGMMTNSLAIIADALHDLGDSFSLGLSWYLEAYSKKKNDRTFSYGYHRFSLLGALINAVVLIVGSLFILSEAVPRLLHPEHSHAPGMLMLAIIGIVVNGIAVIRLRRGEGSLNTQVVAWHLLEDVLGWVAVLVVSITLLFRDIHLLDPLLSIIITLYVLYNVVGNLKRTVLLFLQAVPRDVNIGDVEAALRGIDKVRSIHHTHVWSLDGYHHVLTSHIVVACDIERKDIRRIKSAVGEIAARKNIEHTTLEIEYEGEICSMEGRPPDDVHE